MDRIIYLLRKYMKLISALTFAAIIVFCIINRNIFSAEYLCAHMPEQPVSAFCFVMLIYFLKSVSVAFPLKAIQVIVGVSFPKYLALLINLTGSTLGFITAYFNGKILGEEYISAVADKYPKFKAVIACQHKSTVFYSFF